MTITLTTGCLPDEMRWATASNAYEQGFRDGYWLVLDTTVHCFHGAYELGFVLGAKARKDHPVAYTIVRDGDRLEIRASIATPLELGNLILKLQDARNAMIENQPAPEPTTKENQP